jgi:hypothetical protein
MAPVFNSVGLLALALGMYLVYLADKENKNTAAKAFLLIAGLVTVAWSLPLLSSKASIGVGTPLLAFALFSVAAVKTKGSLQLLSAFIAVVIVLAAII